MNRCRPDHGNSGGNLPRPEPNAGEPLHDIYVFGNFELDVYRGVLRRSGQEVAIRPKPFEVLTYLIRHRGEIVTKAELMDAVWPETAVTDNSLAQCLVEIRRVLGDDSQQFIRTVVRRGYIFAAPVTMRVVDGLASRPGAQEIHTLSPRTPHVITATIEPGRRARRLLPVAALYLSVAALAIAAFLAWRSGSVEEDSEPFRSVPLNSLPGVQRYPSFSPDGNHVAFTWTGTHLDNQDVYIQQIGSGPPLRRTHDTRIDYNPVWSPDGRWIAFLRRNWESGTSDVQLIPPLGGPESKIAEIRIPDTYYMSPPYQTWCPDSSCLVVTDSPGDGRPVALFLLSLATGQKRQITYPTFPALGDSHPAISSDGKWLVFRRQINLHNGELYRLRLRAQPTTTDASPFLSLPGSEGPERLTASALDASYPAFLCGSNELLFSAKRTLWTLGTGEPTPKRLPFVGEDGIMPASSCSRPGHPARLAYIRSFQDTNLWRLTFSKPGAPAATAPQPAMSSTRMDSTPQLSPDGQKLVFASDRSGAWEIWLAGSDGLNAVQLTSMGADSGAPCWSPDSKWVVFQSNADGQVHVYLVPAAGGQPKKLTFDSSANWRPSFSRDGYWIYFASNRQGERRIWKIPRGGGNAVRVTTKPGFAAFESPDGAWLYYNDTMETPSPLWRQPVAGGVPVKVLDGVVRGAFALIPSGIYYIDRPSKSGGLLFTDQPSGETQLRYYDFERRSESTVARNLGNVYLGLTASSDGQTVLYSRVDSSIEDLMLVDIPDAEHRRALAPEGRH